MGQTPASPAVWSRTTCAPPGGSRVDPPAGLGYGGRPGGPLSIPIMHLSGRLTYYMVILWEISNFWYLFSNKAFIDSGYRVQSRPMVDERLRRRQRRPRGWAARTVPSSYLPRGQQAELRLVIHDYSGHPGQVHLSRELARRGHHVEHQYCASY